MKIAVIGNSPTNAGVAMAADLSLAGHEVRFARWSEAEADFEAIRQNGGLDLAGEPRHLVCGKPGKATPSLIDDAAKAVEGAELVVLDFAPADLEARVAAIAPHLSTGQILHINTNSYWSALRAWPILQRARQDGVVVTEIVSPTVTADYRGAQVTSKYLRQRLPVAAFPARKRDVALQRLKAASPSLQPAANVLETSFANLNFLGHPAITLLNIGWFDRAAEAGEQTNFWMQGSTAGAALMEEAQHRERWQVADAYRVPVMTFAAHLGATYGGEAAGFRESIRECEFYRSLPPRSPDIWRRWLGADVPLAHVPFVEVARAAGVPTPIHDAYIALFGTLLGKDFRAEGLTLARLGLEGVTAAELVRYVETGER